ncbi:hypothetical protein EKE94_10810 [Mesobaculum littorinae]|uniref:Flagellar protein FlgN n=1 Tax=Mesobaculum littorinae TaxID=2486419 RepID=A0A438AGV6_9RHOB|nr:hypothetical protein [Mesobaculum littorinae]RVV97951.1 hypothetical protein EKE94_10810 [Mesobaculum littorinae]
MSVVTRLERLLEKERVALVSGRLRDLPALLEQKERLLAGVAEAMTEGTEDAERLRRVTSAAARNAELSGAVMAGLKSVRDRLADVREGSRCGTYGADGARHAIGAIPGRSLHRRA